MRPITAALMLWLGLALIVPLPLPAVPAPGWLPLFKWAVSLEAFASLLRCVLWLGWAAVLTLVCVAYARWAGRLPAKWPGALAGLAVLSLLILLSALPVFRAPGVSEPTPFQGVYGG